MPNTATAHKRLMDDLARIADAEWPPGRLIEHAAARGWGGIYDPRNSTESRHDQQPRQSATKQTIRDPVLARYAQAAGMG